MEIGSTQSDARMSVVFDEISTLSMRGLRKPTLRRSWVQSYSCVHAQSLVSSSWQTRGLKPARLLRSWGFPGKHTKVGCHFLLQRIFLTQGANPHLLCLLPGQADSLPLSHLGSPKSLLGINMFESKGKEAGLVRSNQAFWFAGMSASWHAELVVLKPGHSQANWGG